MHTSITMIDTLLESRQELGSMDKDMPGNIGARDGHPHEDGKVRDSSRTCNRAHFRIVALSALFVATLFILSR